MKQLFPSKYETSTGDHVDMIHHYGEVENRGSQIGSHIGETGNICSGIVNFQKYIVSAF